MDNNKVREALTAYTKSWWAKTAPVPTAAATPDNLPRSAVRKTEFDITLTNSGANKINCIKVVREVTGLGLKEAKDLVEGAPSLLKQGLTRAEALVIAVKLHEVGAATTVE